MMNFFGLGKKQPQQSVQQVVLAPPHFSISGNREMTTHLGLSISDTCKCSIPSKRRRIEHLQ